MDFFREESGTNRLAISAAQPGRNSRPMRVDGGTEKRNESHWRNKTPRAGTTFGCAA